VRELPKKNHSAHKVTTNFANMQEDGQKNFDLIPKTKKCKPKIAKQYLGLPHNTKMTKRSDHNTKGGETNCHLLL